MSVLALVRRWVVGYFNGHDAAVARAICAPDYALRIGDVTFAGRDEAWLPAVDAQMRAYPGLGMTVHETLAGDGWAAAWFSEHGATEGRAAAWSGVGIWRGDGTALSGCVAQEDYMTRRRQLKAGTVDPVDRPAVAPWDVEPAPRDEAAERAVLQWVGVGWPRPGAVVCDDEHVTGEPLAFDVAGTEVVELVSAGDRVAFSVRQRGIFRGGLPAPASGPAIATLDVNGLVRVRDGEVVGGRVIRDRMGLWSRLRAAA
ncbi:nuclear transport factor 2 family protein [Jannaschia sp. W003]|uniref:nuclear transport factor 2 family protein n=1 Tax=Jannaschia sp. W003 TaxID=2867012 RepID=UPI0021A2DA89|nr:nuclear transport factor 2 family protein [Jannaschia sp. W003]UWQ21794.1 hypothetical protein K3554_01835 [Jannaschia sp. W003]